MAGGLGREGCVQPVMAEGVSVLVRRTSVPDIERTLELASSLTAPVSAGQEIGRLTFRADGTELISLPVTADAAVERAGWGDIFSRITAFFFFGGR